jgi:SAM-dependent methyltransferase
MPDSAESKMKNRFSGLEDLYARYRPSYPPEAIEFILKRCSLGSNTTLVDIGCGTGISTRLFSARGVPVIGVEPNDAMRAKAEAAAAPSGGIAPIYSSGAAEKTGLPDGSAAAVLAAQAFHWFDAPKALREFHRILQPAGHAVLMWNERDDSDPFTAAYGEVIRSAPEAASVEGPRARAGEALLVSSLFANADVTRFTNRQELDEEGLIGRSRSASYAPREPAALAKFTADLRRVFAEHQKDGRAVVVYVTSVYVGQRREGASVRSLL